MSVDGVGDMNVDELVVIVAGEIVALVGLLELVDECDDIVGTEEDEARLDELVLVVDEEAWRDVELTLVPETTADGEEVELMSDGEAVMLDNESEVCDDETEAATRLEVLPVKVVLIVGRLDEGELSS